MGNNSLLMLVLYAAAFIGIFYFLLIRPQQRRRRAHEALVSSVKPGDTVVTAGGIHGTVKRTGPDTIVLTIAKGVDIKVARRAIGEVAHEGTDASTDDEKTPGAAAEIEESTEGSGGAPAPSTSELEDAEPEGGEAPRS